MDRKATLPDLSSGLEPGRELALRAPPDIPYWAENLLFALYDPALDLGFWLHLGTVPTDWSMWEDITLAYLPGDDGMLHVKGYQRTPPERRPAGPNLAFRCVEPFRRWELTFDGRCTRSSSEALAAGRVPDGVRQPLAFELSVECATPVWDAHVSATSGAGKGTMRGQSWATDHYQQMLRAHGTVHLADGPVEFSGTGWRDHSRGPRHGGTGATWGGHAIVNCLFPSGRAFGVSRMWGPDGAITLDAGFVVDEHGALHHVDVLDVPRFWDIQLAGEAVPVEIRLGYRTVAIGGTTVKSLWLSRHHALAPGVDLDGAASILAESFARFEWDGEVGYGLCERSEHMTSPAPRELRRSEL